MLKLNCFNIVVDFFVKDIGNVFISHTFMVEHLCLCIYIFTCVISKWALQFFSTQKKRFGAAELINRH